MVRIKRPCLRYQVLAGLIERHGWTAGAELGLQNGETFGYLLGRFPTLWLIGVDLWAPQPSNPGPQTYVGWAHAHNERRVRALARRYRPRAAILKMGTVEAARHVGNASLDFVFIDADHGREAVEADIRAWLPKVKLTGWLTGHDYNWPGVRAAVDALIPGVETLGDNVWGKPAADIVLR